MTLALLPSPGSDVCGGSPPPLGNGCNALPRAMACLEDVKSNGNSNSDGRQVIVGHNAGEEHIHLTESAATLWEVGVCFKPSKQVVITPQGFIVRVLHLLHARKQRPNGQRLARQSKRNV